ATGKEVRQLRIAAEAVALLALSPDGTRLAVHGWTPIRGAVLVGQKVQFPPVQPVQILDVVSGKELCQFMVPPAGPNRLAFTADGKCLLTGGPDGALRVWDVATAKEQRRFEVFRSYLGPLAL